MELREVDEFYFRQSEPLQTCFLALRSLVLAQSTAISETIKYGMPCFCYQKKPMVYLWKDKKSEVPYLLFVHGNLINHPGLESGNRAKMKIFSVESGSNLPKKEIEELLEMAIFVLKSQLKK